jgi:hypothetical protein
MFYRWSLWMRKDTTSTGKPSKRNTRLLTAMLKSYALRKFQKGKRSPQVGDEIEFDGHLVTVENVAQEYSDVSHSNVSIFISIPVMRQSPIDVRLPGDCRRANSKPPGHTPTTCTTKCCE